MLTHFTVDKLSEVKKLLRSAKEDDYENTIWVLSNEEEKIQARVTVVVTNRKGIKRTLNLFLFIDNGEPIVKYISISNCKNLEDLEKNIIEEISNMRKMEG